MVHERNEHEVLCPRCGRMAQWVFLDATKMVVEVTCGECGRYTMSREAFDQSVTENAEIDNVD